MMRINDVALLLLLAGAAAPRVAARLDAADGGFFLPTWGDGPGREPFLRVPLKIFDWWEGGWADAASLPAGTELPVSPDASPCAPGACPTRRLPRAVRVEAGPPAPGARAQTFIYLADTGDRPVVFGAPEERSAPGCSGAPSAVCCGGAEFTLARAAGVHRAYRMWAAVQNGTAAPPRDGSAPENLRRLGLAAAVRLGDAGGEPLRLAWGNTWFDRSATCAGSAGCEGVRTNITMVRELRDASLNDPLGALTRDYVLLVPAAAPLSEGFVVPLADYPEPAAPLDAAAWRACREGAGCGRPAGACAPAQGPTPYAAHRQRTAAGVVAAEWAAQGRPVPKACAFGGAARRPWVTGTAATGFSNGASDHLTHALHCDYVATTLFVDVQIPAALLEAAEPPPAPAPAAGAEPPAGAAAPPGAKPAGPALAFVALLPATPADGFPADRYAAAVSSAAAPAAVAVRVRSVAAAPGGGAEADTVLEWREDSRAARLAARALLDALCADPAAVFTAEEWGAVTIAGGSELVCVADCGPRGSRAPARGGDPPAPGCAAAAGCTCECDAGWQTAEGQGFDAYVYCGVEAAAAPGGAAGGAEGVSRPPPPAPLRFNEGNASGGAFGVGGIVGVLLGVVGVGGVLLLAYKTSCCFGLPCKCVAWCLKPPKRRAAAKGDKEAEKDKDKERPAAAAEAPVALEVESLRKKLVALEQEQQAAALRSQVAAAEARARPAPAPVAVSAAAPPRGDDVERGRNSGSAW